MGIITKKGDWGATTTLGGEEIPKSDVRIHCIGTLDELSSSIGLARSLVDEKGLAEIGSELHRMQMALFRLGTEISAGSKGPKKNPFTEKDVIELEEKTTGLEERLDLPRALMVPGSCPSAAALDVARTVARRFERLLVELREEGYITNYQACMWTNRLSDYLFILARSVEKNLGAGFDTAQEKG